MKKNRLVIASFVVTACVSLFMMSELFAKNENGESNASRLDALSKFTRVVGTIEKYYVDQISIDEIVNKAIEGMLTNLDAHSTFLTKKKYTELKIQTEGEFGGLGITVGMKNGALTVIAPIDDTPAYKAGIKSGDIIIKIEDKSTLNMTIDEAVSLMRGKPKTKVELTVVRKSEQKPLTIDIVRDIIKVQSVNAKTIENEDYLYVRVNSFDKNVADRVNEELQERKDKVKGIVLDLRNNPGGLLDQAVELSDLFMDEGVIVSQKGRVPSEDREYRATKNGTLQNMPLAVLVNGGSASASEIVAGALQDAKKAVVVGEKTFGKGSVQLILPIGNEEALRLTIARYYLPSGRTIQSVGIEPDLVVLPGKTPNEADEFSVKEADLKKHLQGELEKVDGRKDKNVAQKDEKEKRDSKVITKDDLLNDIQLKSAIDVLKAWKIIAKTKE